MIYQQHSAAAATTAVAEVAIHVSGLSSFFYYVATMAAVIVAVAEIAAYG